MQEYHKIQTVFKRDPATNHKKLLMGEYSLPEFEYLKDNTWVFTEKVDGTNIRVGWDGSAISYGGRTDNAQIPITLMAALRSLFEDYQGPSMKLEDVFGSEQCDVTLYGEGYGAKIQKVGGNYRPDQSFVLFDISVGGWWLQREDVEDVAAKLDIGVVPIVTQGSLDRMVEMAKGGLRSRWATDDNCFLAEGIVARPKTELRTRAGHRIITKIKCRDFDA